MDMGQIDLFELAVGEESLEILPVVVYIRSDVSFDRTGTDLIDQGFTELSQEQIETTVEFKPVF